MATVRAMMLAVLSAGVLSGCIDNNSSTSTDNTDNTDSVTIVSVTPSSAQVGVATEFVVVADYVLATDSDGVLDIGFNTYDSPSAYVLQSSQQQVVLQGSGRHTFTVTVTPVDWSPDSFGVTVYLSESPHPSSWSPYASGSAPITVTATAASEATPEPVTAIQTSPDTCYQAEGVTNFCVTYE